MPLQVPSLDDRNYSEILHDALARIPVHNPEWTNFNDSDPGVTMIQLFAFMTESILYRANQIPNRNRLKFLKLLGIPLRPAAAAKGFVTIRNERGPLEVQTLSKGLDVRAGQVRFRTTQGLDVLPIEARVFLKKPLPSAITDEEIAKEDLYRALYADILEDEETVAAFYETVAMPQSEQDGQLPTVDLADTIDGCVWMALLARPGEDLDSVRELIANRTLTIGVMPRLSDEGIVVEPGMETRNEALSPTIWEIVRLEQNVDTPHYEQLRTRTDASILNVPGLVEVMLPAKNHLMWDMAMFEPGLEGTGEFPPSMADTSIGDRVVTWLRLRTKKDQEDTTVKAQISWLDINATMVEQRVTITGEVVAGGTGEPDQCYTLTNTPVLRDSIVLAVGNNKWYRIDDLLAADSEVQIQDPRQPIYRNEIQNTEAEPLRTNVYMLDPESGEICFGDGAHGARPQRNVRIVATYDFGGGRQGNVGIGMINRSPSLPASYKVNNPLRTWGGDNAEDVASAEKTIPRTVKHRDRLVSAEDFEDVTKRTPGVDIGRVEVRPLFLPPTDETNAGTEKVPGVVTVMVIPDSIANDNPKPDQFFLETVCDHLQPRRLITTELYVRGPQYVDIWISVAVKILKGFATGSVRESIRQELFRFLSPLYGGYKERGWQMVTPVTQLSLEAVVARVEGVQEVSHLLLGETMDDQLQVPMAGLQLPRLVGISVTEDVATPIDQLRNAPKVTINLSGSQRWTPIPVIPEEC